MKCSRFSRVEHYSITHFAQREGEGLFPQDEVGGVIKNHPEVTLCLRGRQQQSVARFAPYTSCLGIKPCDWSEPWSGRGHIEAGKRAE